MTGYIKIFFFLSLCVIQSDSRTVFYLEETATTYNSANPSFSSTTVSSLTGSFSSTDAFAISIWIKKLSWSGNRNSIFRVANNPLGMDPELALGLGQKRVLLSAVQQSDEYLYSLANQFNTEGNWDPWETENMLPLNEWVFLCLGIRNSVNTQYGFRYHLNADKTSNIVFKEKVRQTALHTISPSSTIYWGGDPFHEVCYCTLQYVRFYIDYVPDSQDEMINLAINSVDGTLFILHFAASPNTDNNQTATVNYISGTTEYATTAIRGVSISDKVEDPDFGPYNVLKCRPGTLLSYSQPVPATNGFIASFNFKPYTGYNNKQSIFSIRDSSTNFVSIVWTTIVTSSSSGSAKVNQGNWNKIAIELVQAQPVDFGVGYFSGRIWVNSVRMNPDYFGDFSIQDTLFSDTNSLTLDFCGARVSGTTTLDSTLGGRYEVNNFLWLNGVQSVIAESSSSQCALAPYFNTTGAPSFCLKCPSGKYLQDNSCIASCTGDYFLHSQTSSCQKCYYGQYYVGNGICTSCLNDGETLIGSDCIICHSSCRKCTGSSATKCTSCYAGTFLSASGKCEPCASSCETCTGNSTTCTSCPTGTYLLTQNSSCVSCTTSGYFVDSSDQQCKECDSSCQTCNGPTASDCLSCFPDYTLDNNICSDELAAFDPIKALDPQTLQTITSASEATSAALKVQSASTSVLTLIVQGATTTAVLLVDFIGDVNIFRFINVDFPANFKAFCLMLDSDLMPNPYASLEDEYEISNCTIGKFREYGASTAFLQNQGSPLNRELAVLIVIMILLVVLRFSKKCPKVQKISLTIQDSLKWNTFLAFYIGDSAELVLYCFVQIREGNSNPSIYNRFSLAVSCMILASIPILFGYFCYLINKKKKFQGVAPLSPVSDSSKREQQISGESCEIPPSVKMIIADLKLDRRFTRNFLLILMFEGFITVVNIAFLQDYGLVQAILYFTTTLGLLVGVFVFKPFEAKMQQFLFILNNTVKLILSVFAIIIGANESMKTITEAGIDIIGMVMIVLVIVVIVISALVAIATLIMSIKEYCKNKRIQNAKKTQVLPIDFDVSSVLSVDRSARDLIECDESQHQARASFRHEPGGDLPRQPSSLLMQNVKKSHFASQNGDQKQHGNWRSRPLRRIVIDTTKRSAELLIMDFDQTVSSPLTSLSRTNFLNDSPTKINV